MITKTGDKPTLADVDGTIPGRAALMSIKLVDEFTEDPEQMHTLVVEGEYDEDPWTFAMGLMQGIERDWPQHEWSIVGNWRARYLRWRHQMQIMPGPGDYPPEEYVEQWNEHRVLAGAPERAAASSTGQGAEHSDHGQPAAG